jgi:predicted RNase H-like HicB family nuclease
LQQPQHVIGASSPGGPTALGKTEEEARAKLDRAIDKFLTVLDDKIIEAQNDLNMLNEFRAAVEVL